MLNLKDVDHSWTLFLDRDGVINYEKEADYIYHPGEFRFYEGVPEAMKILSGLFKRIIMVTNQRGVEKGLMTWKNLQDIHDHMRAELARVNASIDEIYICTSLDNAHPNRKPQPGLAFQALKDYPEIDFSKSIMVGNNLSDMRFGRNAGMHTVFLKTTSPHQALPHPDIDAAFNDLLNFAGTLSQV